MKLFRVTRVLFLAFLASNFLFGTLAPIPATADPEISGGALRAIIDKVQFVRLENGIRVLLYRRGFAPVFSGVVTVRVGGSDEQIGHTGIAHMLEHMAFKGTSTIGTKDFPKEKRLLDELEAIAARSDSATTLSAVDSARWAEIHKQLEQLWVSEDFTKRYQRLGASDLNATTDADLTRYFVSLPSNSFETWCRMETDRLRDPVMRQFYQERDVVREERRMRTDDSPEGKLYEQLLGIAFLAHPYRNPVIGYPFDVERLTASEVADFHRQFYVPANIVVSVVGDIDPQRDLETIRRTFGSLPVGPMPQRPKAVEPAQQSERELKLRSPASPQLMISYKKPQWPNPDDASLTVAMEIFAGNSIAPLYEELVKKRQVAASVGYDEAPGMAYPNLLVFAMAVKQPHGIDDVLNAFDQTLDRFKREPVTESQLRIAKRGLAVEYLAGMNSNMGIAKDLSSSEAIFNDWRSIVSWYDAIMAVSAEDVRKVVDRYLAQDARVVARLEQSEVRQ